MTEGIFKIFRNVLGSIVVLLVLAPTDCLPAEPTTPQEPFPDSFKSEAQARSLSCTIVRLKSQDRVNCVLRKAEGHGLFIGIYDNDPNGKFMKTAEFCVPSWYQKAKVRYVDLLGDGRMFLDLTFEGNTGTGTLQTIEMYVGWNGKAFVPVYSETIDYNMGSLGYETELTVRSSIHNQRTSHVEVHLKTSYREGQESGDRPTSLWHSTSEWQTVLQWNPAAFQFEEEQSTQEKSSINQFRPDWIQRNISIARASLRGMAINELCENYLEKSGIMNIFEKQISTKEP